MIDHSQDTAAYIITRQMNFMPVVDTPDKSFYEPWGETTPTKTLRLAQVKSSTNVCIRYDPTLLPPPE